MRRECIETLHPAGPLGVAAGAAVKVRGVQGGGSDRSVMDAPNDEGEAREAGGPIPVFGTPEPAEPLLRRDPALLAEVARRAEDAARADAALSDAIRLAAAAGYSLRAIAEPAGMSHTAVQRRLDGDED